MALELKKIEPVELRTIGLDEKWLQAQIMNDTSILGLGELEVRSGAPSTPGRQDRLSHAP